MDGYASDGAAMILKGMKETVKAGLPRAIIADTEVLKNAPMDMIKAGYGDIVGKFSALCDWELSRIVNGEYFCQYIYDTTYQMIENTMKTADGLLKRDENSIKALMEALAVVGIMMSFATSSRPASGSEHHLSHFFEIVGIVNGEPYLPHGTDVAYSTVMTAKIREKILSSKFPDKLFRLPANEYKEKMDKIYKTVSEGCMALQKKIGNYSAPRLEIYHQKENEIRELFKKTPSASEIENILKASGLDMAEFYDIYTEEKINTAIAYAKDLKDRYTVLWLYYDFFGDEAKI
jgi:glycerol-1-phosphate dehydrogenase [NAD(P)+]